MSDAIQIKSGVPQGAHCSPLLFNLFINDIGECFNHSKYLLFADDLKIYRSIKDHEDCSLLQNDLNNLVEWCNKNRLFLNINKCHFISFHKVAKKYQSSYVIDSKALSYVRAVKDLGVIFDENLTFVDHINYVTAKASKVLGYILRSCADLSLNTIKAVYYHWLYLY
uniref:Uncharacterized protein LOC114324180 n=1 Tax=Diabrotica virgifera virgifera TaxID=50390 RepID=A0A6P7F2I6_DIAVI